MKPIKSLILRPDGLRILQCRLLTSQKGKGGKQRTAESRLRQLRPSAPSCPLTKHEKELLETWSHLKKATLSRRTYALLRRLCTDTTSAPRARSVPVPRLSACPVDIRPWLCDPKALVLLFSQLSKFDAEKNHSECLCDTDDATIVYDPWLLARSGEKIPLGGVQLSSIVWERAASFSKQLSYRNLRLLEDAYLTYTEEKGASDLMELVLGHVQAEAGSHWIDFWMRVPSKIRAREVGRWIQNYPEAKRCSRDHVYLCKTACEIDNEHIKGLCYLVEGIQKGADAGQLLDGLRLWQEFGWTRAPEVFSGGTVDTDTLIRLTKLLATRDFQSTVAADLWETMHRHPELTESLQAILDQPYGHRGWLVRLLRCAKDYFPDLETVVAFNRDFSEVARLVFEMDEAYRSKAIEYFEWAYWDQTLEMSAANLMTHISSICAKPFSPSENTKYVWSDLMSEWGGVDIPLASWKRIDTVCRSRNHADALETGLGRWKHDFAKPLMRSGLRHRVRLSLEIIRVTRQTLQPQVDLAFSKLKEHPLMDVDLKKKAGLETYTFLLGLSRDLEKLRRHHSGEHPLREESLGQILNKLEGSRVEKLLLYFKSELLGSVGQEDGLQLHTRLYASAADENRRVYQKLIRRYHQLGEQGILAHPSNQQWLRSHPFVKAGVWLTGLRAEIELPDGSRVFLETERRFEQVLQMGTLVNSCLALDGCNSHSALANAADVNKQVVMAYDADARFLGRQLIGISEQRKLVVFRVYGDEAGRLMPAFAAFDYQLERLLALPLHGEGDYEIQRVVCREWYDDYSWLPESDGEAKIIDRQWGGSSIG
ncbi:MAG: hypothetical protein AB8F34_01355 [Akkermansiaceae bacterium]